VTDEELLATCVADEAAGEIYAGKFAVARVVLNRMALKYESDGTVAGTVEKKFQFSGFWFSMIDGHYTEVEFDQAGAQAKAQELFEQFSPTAIWADCQRAVRDAQAFMQSLPLTFIPGPATMKLTPNTVLYLNPAICARPAWADPKKLDTIIGHHEFYHT
jgi:spore germination cell wall hydrolase CwlJ-like protein